MVPAFPESELPFALETYAKQRAFPLAEKALTEGSSTGKAGGNLATSVPSPQEVDLPTHLCLPRATLAIQRVARAWLPCGSWPRRSKLGPQEGVRAGWSALTALSFSFAAMSGLVVPPM